VSIVKVNTLKTKKHVYEIRMQLNLVEILALQDALSARYEYPNSLELYNKLDAALKDCPEAQTRITLAGKDL
jgi:hypothetical protein